MVKLKEYTGNTKELTKKAEEIMSKVYQDTQLTKAIVLDYNLREPKSLRVLLNPDVKVNPATLQLL